MVAMNGWTDFVFADHYDLLSLDSFANYIQVISNSPVFLLLLKYYILELLWAKWIKPIAKS